MSKRVIITESQFDYWKEHAGGLSPVGKKAYHVVGRAPGEEGNILDIARKIYREGLVPCDNGEVGSVVWFWMGEPFYKDYNLMFSIDVTPKNREMFGLVVDEPNVWATKTIPFEYLNVECAPMLLLNNGYILPNKEDNVISKGFAANFENWMPEARPVTVFTDVAPAELLNQLDANNPNVRFDRLFK